MHRGRKFAPGDRVVVSGSRAPLKFRGRHGVVSTVLCGEYVVEFDDDRRPLYGELMSHWLTQPSAEANIRRQLWQAVKDGRAAHCIVLECPSRDGPRKAAASTVYEVRIVLEGKVIATKSFEKHESAAVAAFGNLMRRVFTNMGWSENGAATVDGP